MRFRRLLSALLLLPLVGCSSTGLYRWVPFAGQGNKPKPAKVSSRRGGPFGPITGPVVYGIEVRLAINSPLVRPADTRAIDARLLLINRTKRAVVLYFNDSRRYDFILRDAAGRKLVQWSDDQPVNQNLNTVIINPDERAEFAGSVSTRDMVAGRTYTLEGLVVGYPDMRQTVTIQAAP